VASRGATTKTATLTACGGAVLEEEELVLLGVRQLRLGAGEELIGLALALLEVPPVKLRTDAVRMASWARPGSSATAVLRGLRCWTPPHECGGQPQAFQMQPDELLVASRGATKAALWPCCATGACGPSARGRA